MYKKCVNILWRHWSGTRVYKTLVQKMWRCSSTCFWIIHPFTQGPKWPSALPMQAELPGHPASNGLGSWMGFSTPPPHFFRSSTLLLFFTFCTFLHTFFTFFPTVFDFFVLFHIFFSMLFLQFSIRPFHTFLRFSTMLFHFLKIFH